MLKFSLAKRYSKAVTQLGMSCANHGLLDKMFELRGRTFLKRYGRIYKNIQHTYISCLRQLQLIASWTHPYFQTRRHRRCRCHHHYIHYYTPQKTPSHFKLNVLICFMEQSVELCKKAATETRRQPLLCQLNDTYDYLLALLIVFIATFPTSQKSLVSLFPT